MQEEPATLPIGAVIGKRYIVEGLLGKGGSGPVYLVRDQRDPQQLFALAELINPHDQERYRFTLEYVSLTPFPPRALPQAQYVFTDEQCGRAYLLVSHIAEPNLELLRLQQPEKRFPLPQVLALMAPIISAVTYLHHQHPPVIHQNLQPASIIVSPTAGGPVLVILGLIKAQGSTTKPVPYVAPGYGAPEQYRGEVSTRTDSYGLGATFYTLLTGIVPADARSRMTQSGSTGIDPLEPVNKVVPAVPMRVGKAIDRAMSLDPHRRFSSVEQFWEELWSLIEHPVSMSDMPSVLAGPPAVSVPTPEPERAVEHTAAAMLLPKPPSVVSMADSAKEPEDLDATEPLPKLPPVVLMPDAVKEPEGPDTTKPLLEAPQIVPVPDTVKEPEDLDATEPLPKLPPVVLMPDAVKEPEGPDTTKPLLEAPQIVPVPDTVKEQEDLDAAKPLPEPPLVVPMSISIKEQEDLDDVMLLPKPPSVVSMADSAKEPEDLDATEPLPKLPPVVPMLDTVKEQAGPDTTKLLPEAPQIVPVPDAVKEQEDLDAAKSLPEPPLVVPMSIGIKEQEDLDDVMLLPKPPRVERASISWRKLGALFIALALLISLGIGAGFLSYEQSHPAAHSATPAPIATSPAHTPTSTSASAIYPTLAGTYTGTIYDISVNMSTTMSLTHLRQSQGNISGYLILGPELQGSGPFSGTVDTAKYLQFTMTDAAGNATLFFEGAMQSATTLSGDYYSCNHAQGGQCHRAPGSYGIWSVTLASSG